jgi:hypothetical protein
MAEGLVDKEKEVGGGRRLGADRRRLDKWADADKMYNFGVCLAVRFCKSSGYTIFKQTKCTLHVKYSFETEILLNYSLNI